MANIKSQIKRNRQNEKRRIRNKGVRSEVRSRTRAAVEAAESGGEYQTELDAAIKRIDKAVTKGVLHKNTAARKKNRLIKRLAVLHEEAAAAA